MRLLVCGGRNYDDRETIAKYLGGIKHQTGIDLLMTGGASGADKLAIDWGIANEVWVRSFAADWKKHGRAAGPIRNQKMLDEGKPDMVLAFPGGRGTEDMIKRAEKAGIDILKIPPRAT